MVVINGNFIGSFKLGDNIICNLNTLEVLYDCFAERFNDREYFYKPIIVNIASIIEAILHDFASRARWHTVEQSVRISSAFINLLRRTDNDKFGFYIDQARSHDLFQDPSGQIYEDLHELRKLRNRVHIQNTKGHLPRDEGEAFIEPEKIKAEKQLEFILRFLHDNHPRPRGAQFGRDFVLPWDTHYP